MIWVRTCKSYSDVEMFLDTMARLFCEECEMHTWHEPRGHKKEGNQFYACLRCELGD